MVSFICDACGNTVKKTQVEKHYTTVCRNCNVLSCLDCGVDFPGDAYLTHTSCVTEAEKYQGNLYQARDKENKGETKQKEWLKSVHNTSSSSNIDPKLRGLLKRLSAYSNIPRKKKKFENFCKNSVNVYDAKTLDQLWELFTGGNDTTTSATATTATATTTTTTPAGGSNGVVNGSTVVPAIDTNKTELTNGKSSDSSDSDSDAPPPPPPPPKKKKKKKKTETTGETAEVETTISSSDIQTSCDTVENGAVGDTEKTKKKKKKKRKTEQNTETVEENISAIKDTEEKPEVTEQPEKPVKKTKKSKKKKKDPTTTTTNTVEEETVNSGETKNDVETVKESKSRKRKQNKENSETKKIKLDDEESENITKEEEEVEQQPKGKFNWHRTIKQILKENDDDNDDGISLKKLQKKVLNAYQEHGLDHRASNINESIAMFDKKVKSYPKAKVVKDRVKLVK